MQPTGSHPAMFFKRNHHHQTAMITLTMLHIPQNSKYWNAAVCPWMPLTTKHTKTCTLWWFWILLHCPPINKCYNWNFDLFLSSFLRVRWWREWEEPWIWWLVPEPRWWSLWSIQLRFVCVCVRACVCVWVRARTYNHKTLRSNQIANFLFLC